MPAPIAGQGTSTPLHASAATFPRSLRDGRREPDIRRHACGSARAPRRGTARNPPGPSLPHPRLNKQPSMRSSVIEDRLLPTNQTRLPVSVPTVPAALPAAATDLLNRRAGGAATPPREGTARG